MGCMNSSQSFRDIQRTLTFLADAVQEERYEEVDRIEHPRAATALQVAKSRFRLEWFFDPGQLQGVAPDEEFRDATWDYCNGRTTAPTWTRRDYIPRFGSRTMVFLHLFSGERREGDLHSALEQLRPPDRCTLLVISVDIIFDSRAGDLTNRDSQEKWVAFLRSGCIAGIYAGPPCETFSRSRMRGGFPGYSVGDQGPRVVRQIHEPHGLDQMKVKEVRQVVTSNRLLTFTITLLLVSLQMSRLMIVEHPAEPEDPAENWLASIWRLFVIIAMRNNEHIVQEVIYQGFYGGHSPKPTSLLVCCGQKVNVSKILKAARTQHWLPESIGDGQTGWRVLHSQTENLPAGSVQGPRGHCPMLDGRVWRLGRGFSYSYGAVC